MEGFRTVLLAAWMFMAISGQDPSPFNTTTVDPLTTVPTVTPTDVTTAGYNTTTTPATTTTTFAPFTTDPTTVVPVTTPTAGPTSSTVAPVPPGPPVPTVGSWAVYDSATNVTCIVARFSAAFHVPYSRTDGLIQNGSVVLSPNATATGTCGEVYQTLNLTWYEVAEGIQAPYPNKLDITFARNISSDVYYAQEITLSSYTDMIYFPSATNTGYIVSTLAATDLDFFPAHVNNSYSCRAEQKVVLPEVSGGFIDRATTGSFNSMQIQAFRTVGDQNFGTSEYCVGDNSTSDIVPIAVGCALAALVVIVLIAYLVGRSRAASRQRGYQSV